MELHQAMLAAQDKASDLTNAEKTLESWANPKDGLELIFIKADGTILTSQSSPLFKCATADEAARVARIIQELAIEQQEKRIAIMKKRVAELFAGVEQS